MPREARAAPAQLPARNRVASNAFLSSVGTEVDALEKICSERSVEMHFQPIIRLDSGDILGYEALTRPPLDGPFSSATELFAAASRHGMLTSLELACCDQAVRRFVKAGLGGKLLLNMSPESIVDAHFFTDVRFDFLRFPGLDAGRVVVELAEQRSETNLERLCEAVMVFRSLGADIAINDLGRGHSSLWLWSELRPELVKIGLHFIHGVHRSGIKFQFLKSIQQIADASGSKLVAEGIEDKADYAALREMGIAYGQGNFIARPAPVPSVRRRGELAEALASRALPALPDALRSPARRAAGADKLLIRAAPIAPQAENEKVFEAFDSSPGLHALAVVEDGRPVGIIRRNAFLSRYGRPGSREAHGRQACTTLMDADPMKVERSLSIEKVSARLVRAEPRHLEGFIFTDAGRYAGLGLGQDVIREILLLQVESARYANPLTLLPGNVPIDEQIGSLLAARIPFVAAYCDLNHFKAFNDAYGYRRGDEMIKLAACILGEACDPGRDFLGHIGGDDFIVLFRSADWQSRCTRALASFARQSAPLFDAGDRERNSLRCEDRAGNAVHVPLASLSIGAVPVAAGSLESHLQVSEAAAEAKKQAKRIGGNALFVERRQALPQAPSVASGE